MRWNGVEWSGIVELEGTYKNHLPVQLPDHVRANGQLKHIDGGSRRSYAPYLSGYCTLLHKTLSKSGFCCTVSTKNRLIHAPPGSCHGSLALTSSQNTWSERPSPGVLRSWCSSQRSSSAQPAADPAVLSPSQRICVAQGRVMLVMASATPLLAPVCPSLQDCCCARPHAAPDTSPCPACNGKEVWRSAPKLP